MKPSQLCSLPRRYDWQSSYVKSAVAYAVLREGHIAYMGVYAEQCPAREHCYSGGQKGIASVSVYIKQSLVSICCLKLCVHQAASGIYLLVIWLRGQPSFTVMLHKQHQTQSLHIDVWAALLCRLV